MTRGTQGWEHDPGDLDFLEGTEALNFTEGGIEEGDRVKVGETLWETSGRF